MIGPFQAAAILISLAAALGWLNARYLKLPSTIGLALMGALASIGVILIDRIVPGRHLTAAVIGFLDRVDFRRVLMDGMLSFLLFAGALHVDFGHLRRSGLQVAILATFGVFVSTILVGLAMAGLTRLASLNVPIGWCFLFGALISPTDPVAVLGVMKQAKVPQVLQATVSGESLFNDGVGVVVFTILLRLVTHGGTFSLATAGRLFAVEALGGALLGWAAGWIGYRAMRSIDDYPVELLITLAIVMGGYALAQVAGVSGPVAMVVAGLLVGNHGVATAMSETTRDHLIKFWSMLDEVLNAVLFLLIGLVGLVAADNPHLIPIALATVPIVLVARAISVGPPLAVGGVHLPFPSSFPILVWGGLRGGISLALALSLPTGSARELLLICTYAVVLFSVLVQGSTVGWLVIRLQRRRDV